MKMILAALALVLMAGTAAAQQQFMRPVTATETLATSTTLKTGRLMGTHTEYVRVVCTAACFVAVMTTPFATGASSPVFIPANVPEIFRIGGSSVVGVQLTTSTGLLYITEMSR